jgi:hypothetical protein
MSEANRPIIRIFCGLRVRSPEASNAPELPASDKGDAIGLARSNSRPFDPQATLGDLLRFHDSASIVARLFAEAHTALAAIKARRL